MRIQVNSLLIENFKSFVGKHTLDLKERGPGVHFVRGENQVEPRLGSNGAGKSTVFDALCWCLYGKTPGGLRNPDIKPWGDKKKTRVVVTLEIDGATRKVARQANPNSILIDEKQVMSEVVEELLGMGFDVFTNTIMLGQSQPLFFDLQPQPKMQLFTDVLNLERWEDLSWKAGQVALELENERSNAEGELAGVETSLSETQAQRERAQQRADDWDGEQKVRIATEAAQLAELSVEADQLEKPVADAELNYDNAKAEADALRVTLDPLMDEAQRLRRDTDRAEREADDAERKQKKLEREIAELGDTNVCPHCGQSLTGTNLEKHIKQLKKKLVDVGKDLEDKVSSFVEADKVAVKAEASYQQARDHAADFDAKADLALGVLNVHKPRLIELRERVKALNGRIGLLEEEQNPHRTQVSQLLRMERQKADRIEQLEGEVKSLTAERERAFVWIKGFKEIRLYVIEEILAELEIVTNTALEDVGLVGWQVRYALEKETKSGTVQRKLTVEIVSPTNPEPVRWESWSGGEGQRLRLVGALALSEVLLNHAGIETNLEILDEPTRHLSGEGVRDMIDFLSARAAQLGLQIWYVDHQAVESVNFASVLWVVKDKDGSFLEEG